VNRQQRRAAQRTIAETPPDAPGLVAVRVGACYQDQAPALRRRLHDELIEQNPVRLGPVEWGEFDTSDRGRLEEVLRLSHQADDEGLRRFILLHPGCVLVVAMVPVPVQAEARA
jgi:hypothetical protein